MKLDLRTATALPALVLVLAGCGGVKVVPSGAVAVPKPADCFLDFLEDPPKRPYIELGELSTKVTTPPRGGAVQVLREPACQLGADAVIVTRNFVINEFGHVMVSGTAVKYRWEVPAPAPTPAPTATPTPAQPVQPAQPVAPVPAK